MITVVVRMETEVDTFMRKSSQLSMEAQLRVNRKTCQCSPLGLKCGTHIYSLASIY
jgi:hypothetical protein